MSEPIDHKAGAALARYVAEQKRFATVPGAVHFEPALCISIAEAYLDLIERVLPALRVTEHAEVSGKDDETVRVHPDATWEGPCPAETGTGPCACWVGPHNDLIDGVLGRETA